MPNIISDPEKPLKKGENKKDEDLLKAIDKAKARHCITINRGRDEVFSFWRNFKNLPLFMKDLKEVRVLSPTHSHWTLALSTGEKIEWNTEVTAEVPGQLISWRSLPQSEIDTAGLIVFEHGSGSHETVVRLSLDYSIPGGRLVEWISFFADEDPDTLALTNLKRLKQLLETGELATVQGQPSGREETSTYAMKH